VLDENLMDLKKALTVFVENVSPVLKEHTPLREDDSTDCPMASAIVEYRQAASEIVLFVQDLASQIAATVQEPNND
jgi:hypothetical protein